MNKEKLKQIIEDAKPGLLIGGLVGLSMNAVFTNRFGEALVLLGIVFLIDSIFSDQSKVLKKCLEHMGAIDENLKQIESEEDQGCSASCPCSSPCKKTQN